MNITFIDLLVLSLASFRLTRLVVYDKITEFLRSPFFDEIKEMNEYGEEEIYLVPKQGMIVHFMGELLSCHWCTGIWSAAILCLFYLLFPLAAVPFLVVLAVAGLAAFIETIIQKLLNE